MCDFPVTIPDAVMMHDFAMTERHVIFLDLPLIARSEACPPPCIASATTGSAPTTPQSLLHLWLLFHCACSQT